MVNPPVNWPTASRRRWRWASGPKTHRQTIGNDGTQSQRLNRLRSAALTLCRDARSAAIWQTSGNAGNAKPEAKASADFPTDTHQGRYARSATGSFASDLCKERNEL